LNGTSTDGLARQVRDELSAAGFDVVSIGTASNSPVAKTSVAYQASHTTSMQTLAGALRVTPQEVLDSSAGSSIVLTLGQDWGGLTSASPSASAPASLPASSPATAAPIPNLKATNAGNTSCVQG